MAPDRKTRISNTCAAGGVGLILAATVLPWEGHARIALFLGLALLCVSHVLTPCQDQITKWWRGVITK